MTPSALKPSHKAIVAYHAKLREYAGQGVGHETGLTPAFHNLLDETARPRGWLLVDQLSLKVRGKTIRPDGTLRDAEWLFPRGYWEAKDSADDLDAEIRKKISKGYPLLNTIFEDTRTGVLFQNGINRPRAGY
jgi:hypothetical protein